MVIIDKNLCIGCGLCVEDCFSKALIIKEGKAEFRAYSCMECGHCIALCPKNAVAIEGYDMDQVFEASDRDSTVDPTAYLNHLKLRRTIRSFTAEPVAREDIEMILEAGRFSPTGGNEQTVSYGVVQKGLPKLRELILEELKRQGDAAVAAGNPSMYAKMWLRLYDVYKEKQEDQLFFNAPLVIAISSDNPEDALIAASHMETMVYALGLGMLYSGFSKRGIEGSPEALKLLGIKENKQVWAVLVVGHPALSYRRSVPRKPADALWL